MNADEVLSRLRPADDTSWRAIIEDESVRLLGRSLALIIQTRSVPRSGEIPEINDVERALALTILENIDHCLAEAQRLLDADASIQHVLENEDLNIVGPRI